MKDFWLSCGHHLLDRDQAGHLLVTDEFLKAYLARPELAPPGDACAGERALHAALLASPRRSIDPREIAAIADPDARENWGVAIGWRDRLAAHRTLEAVYLDLVRGGAGATPPLLINQLVHVILRNALDGCEDAFVLRAAELFFRPQRLALHGGSLIAADEETVSGLSPQPVSPLVAMLGLPPPGEIEVLNEENAGSYFERSDRFDLALDLTAGRRGLAALAQAMERWLAHLLALRAGVEPLIEAIDVDLTWYIGLDAQATAIGDALWQGQELTQSARERIVGLYRLTLPDEPRIMEKAAGNAIYLILAMTEDQMLRMKPQNLITGLPADQREAVS
jgi:hypothetical protein